VRSSSGLRIGNSMNRPSEHRIGGEIDLDVAKRIDALSCVSNRMLGTPSLTVRAIVMGERVQNS